MISELPPETGEEKINRIFGGWLRWSRDAEVLQLLDAVVSQLRRRGYVVTYTVHPPQLSEQ